MGLITDLDSGKYAILSDILGDEDHLGDMDFKVTGTADGITACQMDIKIKGLSFDQLREALEQAREGRHHIRKAMLTEILSLVTTTRTTHHALCLWKFLVTAWRHHWPRWKDHPRDSGRDRNHHQHRRCGRQGHGRNRASDKAAIDAALTRIKQIAFPPTSKSGRSTKAR